MTPLVTPLSFGWFVTLPRDSAFCTNGCCVASRHAVASCASTPLICESIRHHLPLLLPPHPSRTTSPSPEQEQERERGSLNIAVFVVIAACVRCQSGAFPAFAVAAGALVHARHQRPPTPTVAFAARARRQGVAPRREQVRMDDEKCPRNTVGVGPESQLCELVVTRLMQN